MHILNIPRIRHYKIRNNYIGHIVKFRLLAVLQKSVCPNNVIVIKLVLNNFPRRSII